MTAFDALRKGAASAHEELAAAICTPVDKLIEACDIFVAFRRECESSALFEELSVVAAKGNCPVKVELFAAAKIRDAIPLLSQSIQLVVSLKEQMFLNPARYLLALAAALTARGVNIREGVSVDRLIDAQGHVVADLGSHGEMRADAVVVACGAWSSPLLRPFGVRSPIQAGRGYSVMVDSERTAGPIYFPVERIACTPLDGRLRVAGLMEFAAADAGLDVKRLGAMVDIARPLLARVDWTSRSDAWVGPRPCTADGRPLLGRTGSPRIYAAAGHGMWGVTLGPISGKLIADYVCSGVLPVELAPFDPRRKRLT